MAVYAASAALLSHTGPAYNLGRSPSPRSRTLVGIHTAVRSPSLLFNVSTSVLHVNTRITTPHNTSSMERCRIFFVQFNDLTWPHVFAKNEFRYRFRFYFRRFYNELLHARCRKKHCSHCIWITVLSICVRKTDYVERLQCILQTQSGPKSELPYWIMKLANQIRFLCQNAVLRINTNIICRN